MIDADDPLTVAMRFERHPVLGKDIADAATDRVAFPMIHRGRLEGLLLLRSAPTRELYRPDEINLLGHAAQQIGLDLAALEADENRRKAAEWEQQAQLHRTSAQEARAMLELLLRKIPDENTLLGLPPGPAQTEV